MRRNFRRLGIRATVVAMVMAVGGVALPIPADAGDQIEDTLARLGADLAVNASCRMSAIQYAAGGWACVDDVVYTYVYAPEEPVDPDLSVLVPAATAVTLDQAQAEAYEADVQAENAEYDAGLTNVDPPDPPDAACESFCSRAMTKFYWRIDATIDYGVGSRWIGGYGLSRRRR